MASVRNVAAASGALLVVVLLSMECSHVHADCDTTAIFNDLNDCLAYSEAKPPPADGKCCVAVKDVYYNVKPDDKCVCDTVALPIAKVFSVTEAGVVKMIETCIPTARVPPCLKP